LADEDCICRNSFFLDVFEVHYVKFTNHPLLKAPRGVGGGRRKTTKYPLQLFPRYTLFTATSKKPKPSKKKPGRADQPNLQKTHVTFWSLLLGLHIYAQSLHLSRTRRGFITAITLRECVGGTHPPDKFEENYSRSVSGV